MLKDITNKRFGRWIVLKFVEVRYKVSYWLCRCDCGKEKEVHGYCLRSGQSTSCGCYQKEVAAKLKGLPSGQGALRQLFRNYRQQAERRCFEFRLTVEQFGTFTKGVCYYCGVAPASVIKRQMKKGKPWGTEYIYNGVDRLDSLKGYTIDNCVSCCGKHNLMKLDMSVEEFVTACREVANHFQLKQAVA